ncbi:hypothetical protein V7S57_13515 [Caulobacter sp. CCNWLY153]|uniref:hypothetical protein n=1 Tax=unclassified Caulobacter TaxID=2648921 RepID=UPI002FF033AE
MPHVDLDHEERNFLQAVRESGGVSLTPEARSFGDAERLVAKGLVRAVRTRGYPSATYQLSGAGIAAIGRTRAAQGAD